MTPGNRDNLSAWQPWAETVTLSLGPPALPLSRWAARCTSESWQLQPDVRLRMTSSWTQNTRDMACTDSGDMA